MPSAWAVVNQENWPCGLIAIPFASIVGCLGALI